MCLLDGRGPPRGFQEKMKDDLTTTSRLGRTRRRKKVTVRETVQKWRMGALFLRMTSEDVTFGKSNSSDRLVGANIRYRGYYFLSYQIELVFVRCHFKTA